jgi:PKD repeat protein
MTRTLALSATFAASLLVLGCGGGGEQTTAPTPTTTIGGAAPASPTTTVAGAEAEDEDIPLLAWADASPEEGKAPLTVQFTAETEGGKPPFKFTWKFGDGTPDSHEQNPKHTYEKAGKYRADLEVGDSVEDEDSDYIEIEVQ